jgi:hypothetical protein
MCDVLVKLIPDDRQKTLRYFLQVTVVGKQAGREIRPFQTENGDEVSNFFNPLWKLVNQ